MLIKDDNGTTVVNETVPVRPGEKLDESFGPLEPSSDYTATITPISNGTEGKPREEEFRTGELVSALVRDGFRVTNGDNVFRPTLVDRRRTCSWHRRRHRNCRSQTGRRKDQVALLRFRTVSIFERRGLFTGC